MARIGGLLDPEFLRTRPDIAAMRLLGKVILNTGINVAGVIVEVEPYFGPEDPASRARRGGDLARTMLSEPCTALVYGVHRQWLLNVVAHEDSVPGTVLIRAVVPVNPSSGEILGKPILGPGRVTRYLGVDKTLHKQFLCCKDCKVQLRSFLDVGEDCILKSNRIGVREDLPYPLNFKFSCFERLEGSSTSPMKRIRKV